MKAALHSAEEYRLAALRHYGILDTPREADFDDVVEMASKICGTPISVINLIDHGRQWFKAEIGLGVRETPLDSSICAHAILQPGLFVIPDTTLDPRFVDNPLVTGDPHLRFYAGALLETPEGFPLGTVCVLDYKPRELDETQKAFLRLMANQVMKQLELRRINASEHAARLQAEQLVQGKRDADPRRRSSRDELVAACAIDPEPAKPQRHRSGNEGSARYGRQARARHCHGSQATASDRQPGRDRRRRFSASAERKYEEHRARTYHGCSMSPRKDAKLRSDLCQRHGHAGGRAGHQQLQACLCGRTAWYRRGSDFRQTTPAAGAWRFRTKAADCRPDSISTAARASECRS